MASKRPKPEFTEIRNILAFDQAVAKLHEAGLGDEFVAAVERDPKLRASIEKISPKLSAAASPGWSCCITVSDPMLTGKDAVINPAKR
jgi:hypothetical protein